MPVAPITAAMRPALFASLIGMCTGDYPLADPPPPRGPGPGGEASAPCSAQKLAEITAAASDTSREVRVSCSFTLTHDAVITKRLVLEGTAASGARIDCAGATLDGGPGTPNHGRDMIEIRSRKVTSSEWEAPEDIAIRECRIIGSVRVLGMGKNGEAPDVRESSRLQGHTERARQAAPKNITLSRMFITAVGRTPLYLAPGVSRVTLEESELDGEATSVGVYLDAESTENILRDNYLHVTSRQTYASGLYVRKREEIAVDGSSRNLIIGNRLSTLEGGGIYLYRNCGEGGTVRHATPSDNQIIDNVFYYRDYDGGNPAVWLGSRSNDFWEGRWYCGDDAGYPWGSSADDRSFATNNLVTQNKIHVHAPEKMIVEGDESNQPNVVEANETVGE
jgi:hypothetical protein